MLIVAIVVLIYIVYQDARTLREQDPELYHETVKYKEWFWAFSVFAITFAFLPIYILRREHYLAVQREYAIEGAVENRRLLTDAWGNILKWSLVTMITLIVLVILHVVLPGLFDDLTELIISSFVPSLFLLRYISRTIQDYPGWTFGKFVALKGGSKGFFKTFVIPCVIGLGLAYVSAWVLTGRTVQPATPLGRVVEGVTASWVVVLFLVSAILIAPLLEEVIFRGYFFRVAKRVRGEIFAIIIISAVFGLMHVGQYWGDWLAIFMVALVGLALTVIRARTGSTVASAVGHYTYNAGVTLFVVLMIASSNPAYYEYTVNYSKLSVEEKETLLLESIETNPDFPVAYNDLAWLYAEDGRNLEEALRLVEASLEYDPKNDMYLDTKAEVLYRMGYVEEAIEIETNLVDRLPDNDFYQTQLERFQKGLP